MDIDFSTMLLLFPLACLLSFLGNYIYVYILSSKTKASNDELLKEVNQKIEFSNIYIRKINTNDKYNIYEKSNYYNQKNGTILNDYQNK